MPREGVGASFLEPLERCEVNIVAVEPGSQKARLNEPLYNNSEACERQVILTKSYGSAKELREATEKRIFELISATFSVRSVDFWVSGFFCGPMAGLVCFGATNCSSPSPLSIPPPEVLLVGLKGFARQDRGSRGSRGPCPGAPGGP